MCGVRPVSDWLFGNGRGKGACFLLELLHTMMHQLERRSVHTQCVDLSCPGLGLGSARSRRGEQTRLSPAYNNRPLLSLTLVTQHGKKCKGKMYGTIIRNEYSVRSLLSCLRLVSRWTSHKRQDAPEIPHQHEVVVDALPVYQLCHRGGSVLPPGAA